MRQFAADTTVSPERSRAEIEETLRRYGADQFVSGWDGNQAMIGFRCKGRLVRFRVTLPAREQKEFLYTPAKHQRRSADEATRAWEQAIRQRWRALLLSIKAKLESVQSGIEEFEEAFLAQIVLPGGQTMAETMLPQVEEAYRTGEMPRLLSLLPPPRESS